MRNRVMKKIFLTFIGICLLAGIKALPTLAATTGTDANGFSWQSDDGVNCTITGYTGSSIYITIPSTINGYIVTGIGNNAFKEKPIASVTIPNTVTSIGGFAFYYCSSLQNVYLPDSVTSIGNSAFAYCIILPNITLPANLSTIGMCAFQDCKAFTGITIPSSVTSIEGYAFLECLNLTNIIIPGNVQSIGEGAFKDCKVLKSATMTDSVTSLGNYVFYNCQQLSNVRLSNALTDTGTFIFYNCFALKGVTLPSNLKIIGDNAFENCTALTNITIPNGVTRIGHRAFIMCNVLANVTIPNTVKTIDYNAFAHCYAFTNITIPDSVTTLGDYAFYYCKNLTEITIPQSVIDIGFLAFNSCNTNLVMKGIGGSFAQYYANSNSIPFQDLLETAYTVMFYSNGGSAVGSVQAGMNALLTAPTEPTNEGYSFGGWYKESACITPWNFTTDKVTGDITLYAKWISNPASDNTDSTDSTDNTDNTDNTDSIVNNDSNGNANRNVPFYSLSENGGNWTGTQYQLAGGGVAEDCFFFDGANTYYLQADGTPMKDRLTYHPDGTHIIYVDDNGHEVFNSFQYCPSVGYTCYFDSNGYIYKDQITFSNGNAYYLDGNGKLQNNGWFSFTNGRDFGYANWNGALVNTGWGYDPWGRKVFYHWNGMVARGLITDKTWYYSMDTKDGHLIGQFPYTGPAQ